MSNGKSDDSFAKSDSFKPANRLSLRKKAAKKLFRKRNEDASSVDADAISIKSSQSAKVGMDENHFVRKRSLMNRLTSRRRTLRAPGAGSNINRAAGYGSRQDGHILTAEEKLRMYTLKEIVNTEEEYTKLLQTIVEVIIPKIKKYAFDEDIPSVNYNTAKNLFSNIEQIYKFHVKFLAALDQATYPYPYHSHCIGEVFLKHENEFHVYEEYCSNYSKAQKLCYELEADEKLQNHINEWKKTVESKTRKFLRLEGFIIAPVQRICKYPLLLKELAKYTPESHSDHKHVIEAQKVMAVVMSSVNEAERRKIVVEAISDLEKANDLWEKDGCMGKQGFLTKRNHWWKSWSIQWVILDGFVLSHYHQPTDRNAVGRIDLRLCKKVVRDATNVTGKPYSFEIQMPDRSHYMYCTSEQERQEWLTIVSWKLGYLERSLRQASKPVETAIFATLSSIINPTDTTPSRKTVKNRPISSPPALSKTTRKISKNRAKTTSAFQRIRGK